MEKIIYSSMVGDRQETVCRVKFEGDDFEHIFPLPPEIKFPKSDELRPSCGESITVQRIILGGVRRNLKGFQIETIWTPDFNFIDGEYFLKTN